MPCTIENPANIDLSVLEPHVQGMYDYFDQKIGFKNPPTMFFDSDPKNQSNVLGKTAYYDPNTLQIHIYTDGRHPKDMLRSIAHELIHHQQNLEGRLDVGGYHGEGYYLENKELKKLEHEAMLEGNALLREYEDTIKKENNQMSLKEWKNNELNKLLMKKFGILKEEKKITHMCALEVTHKKTGQKGHPIKHTLAEGGQVSHYTVEFKNVIVENIAVENLDIVVQEMHTHKRDDEKEYDKDKETVKEEELEESKEELEESKEELEELQMGTVAGHHPENKKPKKNEPVKNPEKEFKDPELKYGRGGQVKEYKIKVNKKLLETIQKILKTAKVK
tara:strand:+ start:22 stop:1020 length:999 start_codon:yes stop_codon:yes gene_type:complete